MITHDGTSIPRDPNPWDPENVEWVSVSWDEEVSCKGEIVSSEWVLPDTWSSSTEEEDIPIALCDGTTFDHGNRALLSTTSQFGLFVITNRVGFSDGTSLDKSRKIKVKPT